jgi:hypothetical protein
MVLSLVLQLSELKWHVVEWGELRREHFEDDIGASASQYM